MIFRQIAVGNMDNFVYLIGDDKECALIDAGWDCDKIIKISREFRTKIKKIIITHTHYDHINDLNSIFEKTNAVVYVHHTGIEAIKKINNKINLVGIADGDVIEIGRLNAKIIHTPGHIPDAICILVENKLFTGDTLFVGSIGRTDFPESNPHDMKASLNKLKKLDDNIEVWPGHDYGKTKFSTVGKEKKSNYFMR